MTRKENAVRCRAVSKRTGKQCRHPASQGSEYCATHRRMYEKSKSAAGPAGEKPASAPAEEPVQAPTPPQESAKNPATAPAAYPSHPAGEITSRIMRMRDDPDLLTLRTEVATLKAMLEDALGRLEEARAAEDADTAVAAAEKRVESLTMSILSAGEKFARVEERRRGVLTASEIGDIVEKIKERVIDVVRTADEDDSPEKTAERIAEAFSAIEIVGSSD